MKVLYLHQHFSTRAGAAGTRSYEMAQALLAAGHQVHMVCGSFQAANTGLVNTFDDGVRRGHVCGIQITEFEIPYANKDGFYKRALAFLSFALSSVKLALTENYDVVFATSTPLTASIPGIVAKVIRGKKFVFEVRDLWPELPREMGVITNPFILSAMSCLEWVSYWASDACVGLSPGIVDGIRKRTSKNKPITLIPNGCDLDLFDRARGQSEASGSFAAVFSGAHGKANGLDAVLDAAAVLLQRGRDDIRIEFIGEGSEKDRLIKRVEQEGLRNCDFFNSVPKTELADRFAKLDVGLMILDDVPAFYFGTSPNKFFDYIAAGLPVLTNYPGWVANIINDAELGYVVPPANPKAFADALEYLAENPARLSEMSSNAKICAKTKFNRAELGSEFVLALEAVQP